MLFELKKEGAVRTSTMDTLENRDQDRFNLSRDPFVAPKPAENEGELGMEFLVDNQEEEEEEEEEQESDDGSVFEEYPEELPERQVPQEPVLSYEETMKQKGFYLSQLNRIIKRGVPARKLGMEHSLQDIKGEVFRIKKEAQLDAGVNFCKQGLVFFCSAVEMSNNKFKIGGKLDGWSQAVMSDIDSYEEVFEELYEKYFSNSSAGPEFKLISMLAGSAFMFHLQQSMMEGKGFAPKQREMDGPSIDTDALLKQLNDEVDLGDMSSISDIQSNASSEPKIVPQETKKINLKKTRGRPKKSKN
jgi:hypothetical protein